MSHRRGDGPRHARDLPPRQPRPARRHEQPRASWPSCEALGARPDARRAGACRCDAAVRPRRAAPPRRRRAATIALFDESYNANPASMRAALRRPRPGPGRAARPAHRRARRHAGARAGWAGAACRRSPSAIEEHGIDLVFAAGPLMKQPLAGAAARAARRLGPERGRTRTAVLARAARRRRRHRQGLERQPHGQHRRRAESPLRAPAGRESRRTVTDALLARRLLRRRSAS